MLRTTSLVSLCLVSMTAIASAQPAGDASGTNTSTTTMQPPPNPEPSGPTLRNGFSLSVGQEFGTTNLMNDISGQLYGVDWRIGAQINKALGIYLQSHLSLGSIQINGRDDYTGNFATAAVAEYTLPFRLFVGGGVGYGVLNNPSGPLVQARVGYYPFEKTSQGKARRLNVALDTRLYFVSEGPESMTMKHVALSIGYDRF